MSEIQSLGDFYQRNTTDLVEADARLALIAKLVARRAPKTILDIGCGRGALLALLGGALPYSELIGIDVSESAVAQARERGFDARVGNVTAGLPIADHSLDAAIFGEIIEHLIDPDAALLEIARILRVGGMLVVTTPNLASWFNRVLLLAGIQPIFTETSLHANLGRRFRALGQWRPTQGHLKVFTRGALVEMLHANGYHIEWFGGAPFPMKTPLHGLDRALARFPSIASNFVVVARNTGQTRSSYAVAPRADIQL